MIAVECFPDEALLHVIGVPMARIVHGHGRGNVLNALLQGRVQAGLIDEDPNGGDLPQLASFAEHERIGALVRMAGRNDPDRKLIMICPRLEEWLLRRAAAGGINPGTFGMPETPQALHRRRRYDILPKYSEFLRALLSVDQEMLALRQWVLKK